MVPDYIDYRFYKPLKRLMYMGEWTPDMVPKPSQKRIFYAFIIFCQVLMVLLIVIQLVDLYLVLGNLRKMTFNFCSSTVVLGIFGKMILLRNRREKLKSLQYNLWKDSMRYNGEEDTAYLDAAFKKFSFIRKILYAGPFTVIPVWGIASYFSYKWGPRLLPFAGYIPIKDLNDDASYLPALVYEIIMAFYVIQTVLESDLTMLGIVLQVEAHCQILSKNLIQLNGEFFGDESGSVKIKCKEVNEYLKREKILRDLKAIVKRHLELLQYCEDLEYVFNRCMVIQLLGGSFLILMIGVETTRRMTDISVSLGYQMMYLIFVMIDIYVICYHFTTLATECTKVGHAAYDSGWYKMGAEVKRTLCLIMTRTQKPPKFTYGKLFVIDVNAFMHLIKNIYSWLMLLRQLEMK